MTDPAARFEELYAQHFRAVLRYSLARVSPDVAPDAVAETFLVAWRRLDDIPEDSLPWLLGVARRVVAGQRRTIARRDALDNRLLAVRTAAQESGADAGVVERIVVLDALALLSPVDQEVLALIAWDELPVAAAAAALGVTSTAFRVRLHRARRRLAAVLRAGEKATVATGPASDHTYCLTKESFHASSS